MLLDPVINVLPATGTPGWLTTVIGAGAALAGSGVTLLGQWLTDRRRFKREDRQRWQNDVRILSARLLTLAYDHEQLQYEDGADFDRKGVPRQIDSIMAEARKQGTADAAKEAIDKTEPMIRDFNVAIALDERATKMSNEMYSTTVQLELIAPKAITQAAWKVTGLTASFGITPTEAQSATKSKAERALISALRTELGIDTPDSKKDASKGVQSASASS